MPFALQYTIFGKCKRETSVTSAKAVIKQSSFCFVSSNNGRLECNTIHNKEACKAFQLCVKNTTQLDVYTVAECTLKLTVASSTRGQEFSCFVRSLSIV